MYQVTGDRLSVAEGGGGACPFQIVDSSPDQMQMYRFAAERDGDIKAGGNAAQATDFSRLHGAERHGHMSFTFDCRQRQRIAVKRQSPIRAVGAEVSVKKHRALVCEHDDSSKGHDSQVCAMSAAAGFWPGSGRSARISII
ncbi:hypothetical protein D3C81_1399560 [compost metagenome]